MSRFVFESVTAQPVDLALVETLRRVENVTKKIVMKSSERSKVPTLYSSQQAWVAEQEQVDRQLLLK